MFVNITFRTNTSKTLYSFVSAKQHHANYSVNIKLTKCEKPNKNLLLSTTTLRTIWTRTSVDTLFSNN